jgi:hypothetical protein
VSSVPLILLLLLTSHFSGVILFGSHHKLNISPRILTDPPPFNSQLPPAIIFNELSLRELYIQSLEFISLERATKSPLYAVSTILHLNCFLWNQIITAIREEDQKVGGISDTTIGHTEEIKKSYTVVQRGGTLGWHGVDEETRDSLVEDFKHLVEQTELLWQTRDKMAAIRQRNSEARWSALTNGFTYLYSPQFPLCLANTNGLKVRTRHDYQWCIWHECFPNLWQ